MKSVGKSKLYSLLLALARRIVGHALVFHCTWYRYGHSDTSLRIAKVTFHVWNPPMSTYATIRGSITWQD